MNFNTKPAARIALAVLVAASLAACASKPKPGPMAQGGPPPPPSNQGPQADTFTAPPPTGVDQSANGMGGAARPGSQQDFVVNVGDRVYFDLDSYDVRSDARPMLDNQASWLNRYPSVRVRIEGNCDERGTREYNLALGARRANSVAAYLASRGISPSRITTVSYGKERPVDTGDGEEAWSKNRNARTNITEGAR